MTAEEKAIYERAIKHAKKIKGSFAKKQVDGIEEDSSPISTFMAGSPGAGKTETVKSIIAEEVERKEEVLVIDADEYRKEFEEYDGSNSYLFQHATSILVDAVHDRALKKSINFIMDSTLSNEERARKNIERSLSPKRKHKREAKIVFVYQEPLKAWEFVCAREKAEGRHVSSKTFAESYINSWQVVNKMKEEFKSDISLWLVVKNIEGGNKRFFRGVERIESYLSRKHNTVEEVMAVI